MSWLGIKGSNPDSVIQSHLSCHLNESPMVVPDGFEPPYVGLQPTANPTQLRNHAVRAAILRSRPAIFACHVFSVTWRYNC